MDKSTERLPAIPAPRTGRSTREVAAGRYHGFVSVQGRGTVAIPPELRKRYSLDQPGAQFEVSEREDGVLELRPMLAVPASEAWFWTPQWQRGEQAADADVEAGRVQQFDSTHEFSTWLAKIDKLAPENPDPAQ